MFLQFLMNILLNNNADYRFHADYADMRISSVIRRLA